MAKIKTIFPPQVPSFLPAFDGKGDNPKFYFKPSIVNTMDQIVGLHLVISSQNTNESVLKSSEFPLDMILIDKPADMNTDDGSLYTIRYDAKRKYYYFIIDKAIFPKSDSAYKVQVRAVSSEAKDRPDIKNRNEDIRTEAMKKMSAWLEANLMNFSEWSIVTTMLPITVPEFGLTGLKEKGETRINSSGFNFIGYYNTQKGGERETLSSYTMNLFHYKDYEDKSTWKLIGSTGERTIGIYERVNIEHVFDRDLEKLEKYVVSITIKSRNLYTKTKFYKIIGDYPAIELFNSINLIPNPDEGKIEVKLQAKQILLKPSEGTEIEYYKDSEHATDDNTYSFANIKGSISTTENFAMNADEDKWILQARVAMTKIPDNRREAYANPFIIMSSENPEPGKEKVLAKVKLICYKVNIAGYPLMNSVGVVTQPQSEWVYRFVARKEIVHIDRTGKETILLEQDRVFTTKEPITVGQEYYMYLIEEKGRMDLVVITIKERIGGIITWLKCLE